MRVPLAVLLCTVGILALLGSCSAASGSYTFKVGERPYADKLVAREEIFKYAVGQFEKAHEIRTFVTDGKAKITKIEVMNLKKNGAIIKLINGGPGYTYVTIQFESQIGEGIHYIFQMYAKYL